MEYLLMIIVHSDSKAAYFASVNYVATIFTFTVDTTSSSFLKWLNFSPAIIKILEDV